MLINRQDVIKACSGIYDISDVIERLPSADDGDTEISKIKIKGAEYTIGLDQSVKEDLFEEFLQSISKVPVVEHKCNNCGGTIEMDADNHIFVCPYCGSVYAIGTRQVNG